MGKHVKSFLLLVCTVLCFAIAAIVFFTTRKNESRNVEGPWPECISKTGEDCKDLIIQDGLDSEKVVIIPEGSMVTGDYDTDRVRIYVDEDGIVQSAPKRG
mmetsp:Transcript_9473/g.13199  ORF Transcript_9473/g.13199 Transcript_9473/m.13199 type:complete len:101 (-) Transcript_9473:398-700(-)